MSIIKILARIINDRYVVTKDLKEHDIINVWHQAPHTQYVVHIDPKWIERHNFEVSKSYTITLNDILLFLFEKVLELESHLENHD
jgi:hypothetical protein